MNTTQWRQQGNIFLWSYKGNPKNYKGWHLTCDNEGCSSLLELTNCFQSAITSEKRTIILAMPSQSMLFAPNCKAKVITYNKLVLVVQPDSPDTFEIQEENDKITISCSNDYLESIKKGIIDINQGNGDYSIGKNSDRLWFWWHIG